MQSNTQYPPQYPNQPPQQPATGGYTQYYNRDPEMGIPHQYTNLDEAPVKVIGESCRQQFIGRVFGIVFCELAFTTLLAVGAKLNVMGMHDFYVSANGQGLLPFAMFGMIATTLFPMCCCPDMLKKFPVNILILGVFTASTGFLVSFICLAYQTVVVIQALAITLSIVLVLTLYAINTTTDVTSYTNLLAGAGMGFVVMILVGMLCHSSAFQMLISMSGACLFSIYIVWDIQMIVGGKHRQLSFGEDEYVLASLMLYLDVVNLLLMILDMLGAKDGGGD